jgi:hypothetical protein
MRMSIHDVVSVEVQAIETLPTCKVRTLIIQDIKGNKYEITLFADDAAKLALEV